MDKLKDLAVEHPYYCSETNYYCNDTHTIYDNWETFYAEFHDADKDYNFLFRWDVKEIMTEDKAGNEIGSNKYSMDLFFMGQRKGQFFCNSIRRIDEDNLPQIVEFLTEYKDYMVKMWAPILK